MSRRDERDIARRLAGQPGGEPPPDLLARLKADVPPRLEVGEEAAARRRPAALGRRWLLAASLAAMAGAGALSLRTMGTMGEVRGPQAPPRAADRRPAAPSGRAADRPAPAGAGKSAAGPAPSRSRARLLDALAPAPPAPPKSLAVPQAAPIERRPEPRRDGAAAGLAAPPATSAAPPANRMTVVAEAAPQAAPAQAPPLALQAESAGSPTIAAAPASPAPPETRAKAGRLAADLLRPSQPPGPLANQAGGARAEALKKGRIEPGPAGVQRFAAFYDSDGAPDRGGWSLAAGGAPPPPPVAGQPSPPAPETRWVRFRLRATEPAADGPGDVRVEIAWSPAAAERRLLGGESLAGAADVYTLEPAALRHGWTAVYEVRFAPEAVRAAAGPLAILRVRSGGPGGPPERELPLTLADFSPAWREAPAALRLPCLAAAFAERRAAGGDLSDLLAAARSLAAATGDDRASDLVVRMVTVARPSPAGPP